MRSLGRLLAGMLALGTLVVTAAFDVGAAERFEFLAFTPPPGWLVSHAEGGRQYVRSEAGGAGVINLLASRPANGAPAEHFAEVWRAHATRILTGPAPVPIVRRDGEVTVAIGARQVASQGTTVRVAVTVIVWRGRALGVVGVASGAARQTELDVFFNTLRVEPDVVAAAPHGAPMPAPVPTPAPAAAGALGFDVPMGYVQERRGEVVLLSPAAVSERTPCVYGIAPPRPATGDLEADAEAALLEVVVPGWRRIDSRERRSAMRGVSAAGWDYVWYRTPFQGELGGQPQAVNAMAMVLPAGPGRVHVVWGIGSISRCLLDDATFEQLFHSLRPSGWRSDEGRALTRALVGAWRYTASAGLQQLTFTADGRYARDLGNRARLGVTERTATTASGGRFTLRDGLLTLVPDHRPQSPDRYRVRLYDESFHGGWKRVIALLDAAASPPLVVPYYRVDEGGR